MIWKLAPFVPMVVAGVLVAEAEGHRIWIKLVYWFAFWALVDLHDWLRDRRPRP